MAIAPNVVQPNGNGGVRVDPVVAGRMAAQAPVLVHGQLEIQTKETCGFCDLTDHLQEFLTDAGLTNGMLVLLSLHTTAGLLVNELETGFRSDFRDIADRIAPPDHRYVHDDLSVRFENLCPEDAEFPNGHAHLKHALFGAPSLTLPVHGGRLVLGRWQRVFLVEFDRARLRRVAMHGFGLATPALQTAE